MRRTRKSQPVSTAPESAPAGKGQTASASKPGNGILDRLLKR
jgi:hypothetical protein